MEIPSGGFVEGTEVVVQCIFTAYNIKGRTGFAFKLLEIFKLEGDGSDLDDGLVLRGFALFPKRRRIDKGKEREA